MIKKIKYGTIDGSYTNDDLSRYNLLHELLGLDDTIDQMYKDYENRTINAKGKAVNKNINSMVFGSSAFQKDLVFTVDE